MRKLFVQTFNFGRVIENILLNNAPGQLAINSNQSYFSQVHILCKFLMIVKTTCHISLYLYFEALLFEAFYYTNFMIS